MFLTVYILYNQMKESLKIMNDGYHFDAMMTESELFYEISKLNHKTSNLY